MARSSDTHMASRTGRILGIALKQAGQLAKWTLYSRLAGGGLSRRKARKISTSKGLASGIAAAAVARVATRSVPGALAVSGAFAAAGLLGKAVARRRRRKAQKVEDPGG